MHYGNNWKLANVLEVEPGQTFLRVPFTLYGMGALTILTVMALTSWDYFLHAWTPRRWKLLHMAVYAGYAFVVIHFTARFVGEHPVKWKPLVLLWLVALAVASLHLAAALKEARGDRPAPAGRDGLVLLGSFADLPEGRARTGPRQRRAHRRRPQERSALGHLQCLPAPERPARRRRRARRLPRMPLARLPVRSLHRTGPARILRLRADVRARDQGQPDVSPIARFPPSDGNLTTMKGAFLANPRGLGYTESPAMKQKPSRGHRPAAGPADLRLRCRRQPADATRHENGRLGLYNAECPLAELAAVHADGWAPESLAIASPEPIDLPIAVTSSGWVPSPSSASPIVALHLSPSPVSLVLGSRSRAAFHSARARSFASPKEDSHACIVALALTLGLLAQAAPAPAQDAEALRREMEQMRKQFEAMQEQYKKAMDSMAERLERVEARPQPAAAAPAPPVTAAAARPGSAAGDARLTAQRPPGSDAIAARPDQAPPALRALRAPRPGPAPLRHGRHGRLRRQPDPAQRAEEPGRQLPRPREPLLPARGRGLLLRPDRSLRPRRGAGRGGPGLTRTAS